MRFIKYQALGNDYCVLEPQQAKEEKLHSIVPRLCDRHFGAGSDGVLWGPLPATAADFGLRIFNPDGSEAEKSGNGLRIFALSILMLLVGIIFTALLGSSVILFGAHRGETAILEVGPVESG